LEKERKHYEVLKKKYIIDPNAQNEKDHESKSRQVVEQHPLSLDEKVSLIRAT
jgi:hypothetical protein